MELFPWKLMQFKCSVKGRPVLLETDDSWGETIQISTFFKLSNLNKENIFQSGLISLIVGSDYDYDYYYEEFPEQWSI